MELLSDTIDQYTKFVSRSHINTAAGLILDTLSWVKTGREFAADADDERMLDEMLSMAEANKRTVCWMIGDADGERVERWIEMLIEDPRHSVVIAEIWNHAAQAIKDYKDAGMTVR